MPPTVPPQAKKPLLFTLFFLSNAGSMTLGQAIADPEAVTVAARTHVQPVRNVTRLNPPTKAVWAGILGCEDCEVSRGTTYGNPRRVVGTSSTRLSDGEAAVLSTTLLASDDCSGINASFGAGTCDPASQRFSIKLAGSRLITTYHANMALIGRRPDLHLPPPVVEDP